MRYFLFLALLLTFVGCRKDLPETLIEGGYDEQEMSAAIAKAQGSVDAFLSELNNPQGTDHSVKAAVQDQENVEHFWLTDITFANDEFEGLIGNEPGMVSNVQMGQKFKVKKSEISDWMYMKDGKMYGNYTMRPLLKTMPQEEAAFFQSMLAEP